MTKKRGSMQVRSKATRVIVMAMVVYVAAFAAVAVGAQTIQRPVVPPTSLKSVPVPEPPNLADFVKDRQAAIALGKALFWDTQASSDSAVACATCHFHAGADARVKNEIDPGLNRMIGGVADTTFDPMASGDKGGPNYTLAAADFPFHQLLDPADRESVVTYDSNDIVGSAGVYNSEFVKLIGKAEADLLAPDGVFQIGPVETRRVTGRNTPTNINAVLNMRNFWDGRANFVFNGVTPFGPRDKNAQIWIDDQSIDPTTGAQVDLARKAYVRMMFASAASQAVGPILNATEMSAAGRVFADVCRRLTLSQPLGLQEVSATDSVLGPYRDPSGTGLTTSYEALIQQAFWPEFWQMPDALFQTSSGMPYRQIEMNFSLFWGIAIQMYESTLISDDSRFDRYAAGDTTQLTSEEQHGLAIFSTERGLCVRCHAGAEFTSAATRIVLGSGPRFPGDGPIEHMRMGDQDVAIYDNSFYNIGVVPADNDLGVGGSDPFGNPLSFAREFKQMLAGQPAPDAYTLSLDPCTFQVEDGCISITDSTMRDAVDGSFKVPTLRNVELTGPYFHNGGYGTLEQVVDFYSRGGNVRQTGVGVGDTSGHGTNTSNLDIEVFKLNFTDIEKADLVAFLKSLTDDRVRFEQAPFDHPSIRIVHGAVGDNTTLQTIGGLAVDEFIDIPAVGAAGRATPILPFAPK
jgi:cytochrome c peroxidase